VRSMRPMQPPRRPTSNAGAIPTPSRVAARSPRGPPPGKSMTPCGGSSIAASSSKRDLIHARDRAERLCAALSYRTYAKSRFSSYPQKRVCSLFTSCMDSRRRRNDSGCLVCVSPVIMSVAGASGRCPAGTWKKSADPTQAVGPQPAQWSYHRCGNDALFNAF
jgi:hypothetical protein